MGLVSRLKTPPGFTLLELVFALLIFALMLSFAYGGLTSVMRTKGLLDDSREARSITNSILLRLTRELQLASAGQPLMPRPDEVGGEGRRATRLLGERERLRNDQRGDSITFTATEGGQYVMDGSTHTGLVQITYRVEEDPEQRGEKDATYYLIRDETPYKRPFDKAFEQTMTFPVTKQLEAFELYYFDPDKGQWVDEWSAENNASMPAMIQFTVKIRTPSGKRESFTTAVPVRSRE